ncbi:lipid droplet-associated hydrolase-like [Oppia nitens]|uniref:lipid droplet-associated hydrolase-like n=1 Tax=Oppia nitens TaxID=1686743 RepID=UPI0023D9EE3F|nr:lipid droplet-associated hydrolase-like [Oppia nitens]
MSSTTTTAAPVVSTGWSWIVINSVPTRLIHYGFNTTTASNTISNDRFSSDKPIIVFISGNPGEVSYYEELLALIHMQTKLSVIGLSHAGHNIIDNYSSNNNNQTKHNNENKYLLNGQIDHKRQFIDNHLSGDSKIILIGHSIGCYIILELMDGWETVRQKVLHSILIFPTIESMASTSQGSKCQFMFQYFKYPILALSYLLDNLSDSFKRRLIKLAMGSTGTGSTGTDSSSTTPPNCVVNAAINLFNPNCLMRSIEMALNEFNLVNELNTEAIAGNEQKLTFFYGDCDHWCPIDYYQKISQLFPNCDIRLCLQDIDHAFVTDRQSTHRISQLVVEKIQSIL